MFGVRVLLLLLLSVWSSGQIAAGGWLDRPLETWNAAAAAAPTAPRVDETRAELTARCRLEPLAGTAAQRAVAAAGWIPFLLFDRELVRGDVEAIGGMAASDGMCRPAAFNVFVFVAGRFAGTLSPLPMSSRTDGSAGAIRLLPNETITAEFARYQNSDALCCPSSRIAVTFRISRNAGAPVVTPVSSRTIRG